MSGWPLAPLFKGLWKTLDAAESVAVVSRFSAAQALAGAEPTALRAAARRTRAVPLRCYPSWLCVEIEWRFGSGERGLSALLYGPGSRMAALRFDTGLLHALNDTEAVALQPEASAAEYLRLYLSQISNDDARFIVIDDLDELPGGAGAHVGKRWAKRVVPIAFERTREGFAGAATVLLGDALSTVHFTLEGGRVDLVRDENLARLDMPAESVRGPFRLEATQRRARGEIADESV